MHPVLDRLGRPLRNLRLSVTDRCNLRCQYCMPEDEYRWLPKADVLSFEEISRLADAFMAVGVDEIRLTGGEPLLRTDVALLVEMLARKNGLRDLAMTTNGVLLERHAGALRRAGLHRLTVSLDTLDPETFRLLARRDDLPRVLGGIDAAAAAGFAAIKIDTVLIAGVNDGEILDLLEFARARGAELRFIEYMDVGGATNWQPSHVVTRRRVLEIVAARHGNVVAIKRTDSAPAERFRLPDGTVFGIIASVTQPFCRTCDRSRLTADGMWFRCLYAGTGTDLRAMLRNGASDAELAALIGATWRARDDRGAEVRAETHDRRPLLPVAHLRENPHLEMHTRGG